MLTSMQFVKLSINKNELNIFSRILGLWWALATAMIINAGVYQIFLSRINWHEETKKALRRVGCRPSVVGRQSETDTIRNPLESNEKSGRSLLNLIANTHGILLYLAL